LHEEYLLNVGTIEERKNIFSVVKAIKGTAITLVVVGKKTKYFNSISKYIDENALQNQIIFLENVALNELAAIYKNAKIFIYPSVFEGFGIPIVEALYSKVPVITTQDGCFWEAGGESSIYIDSKNVEDIKKNIVALWYDKVLQEKMRTEGLKFVQKFNDDLIATNMLEAYNLVLEKE
jgi:glycosyltransferase involved in cell wall biosynthesis